jgi:DNA-binding transcriptional regulator YbjK
MPVATTETIQDKRKAPETRECILRTALAMIGREGIGAVSNRRLAAQAGVSLGSLTYHFPSQASLLRESLLLYVGEEVARMEAITADMQARCPSRQEVAAEVQRIAEESVDRPERLAELELHLFAARDPALQEASRRCFAAYEALAAAALQALGVPEAARHARTVVAVLTGMGVQRLGTGSHDAKGTAAALLTIVRGALAEGESRSPTSPATRQASDPTA